MQRFAGLAALLVTTCTALAAKATEYVTDPLTDASFVGRGGSVGGSFDASGWTITRR